MSEAGDPLVWWLACGECRRERTPGDVVFLAWLVKPGDLAYARDRGVLRRVERQRVGGQTEVVPTGTNTVGVKPRWRWGTVTVMATWADSPDTAVNLHCPAGHRFGAITGKRVLSYFHDGYADDQGVVWLTREGPLRP